MTPPSLQFSEAKIYLVRHGETQWNCEGRFQGALDSPLTERGITQARACGSLLADIADKVDAVIASPLGRTRQTEAVIRSIASYPATVWESRLAEVSIGSWDGLTDVDIDAGWPGLLNGSTPFDWYFRSPDGERFDAAMERVCSLLCELSGVVVAISHGLTGRLIRGAYLGLNKEETLSLPVPQDVVWLLAGGQIGALRG